MFTVLNQESDWVFHKEELTMQEIYDLSHDRGFYGHLVFDLGTRMYFDVTTDDWEHMDPKFWDVL